ncbi:hypothetical protein GCM10020255_018280 [Rhodococcus baikonurensis]
MLETAVKYGYSSAEAFTRAFTAFHGVSPGAVKRAPAVLKSQPKLVIHVTLEGATPMDYMLVEKPALTVVGFKTRVPLVHEGPNSAIEDFTRSVDKVALRGLRELSDQEPAGIVSVVDNVAHPRTEGTELDYYLGVVTGKPSPMGFDVLTVDAHVGRVHRRRVGNRICAVLVARYLHGMVPGQPFSLRTWSRDHAYRIQRRFHSRPVRALDSGRERIERQRRLKQPPGRMEVTTRLSFLQIKQTVRESVSLRWQQPRRRH